MSQSASAVRARASSRRVERDARTVWPALVAALLGVFILFGVGFANPLTIHNAAHDARHAFSFPCH